MTTPSRPQILGVPPAPAVHRLSPEQRHPELFESHPGGNSTPGPGPLPPVTAPSTGWWTTSRRRVFYDAHTPDWADPHQRGNVPDSGFPLLSRVNPDADIAVLADAGVDSVVLFAKCQYGNSYYPTTVGRRHSALDGRDLFGEQLRAAHARGIRVIAYFSNMWDTAAAGEHPDWMLVPSPARGSTGRWPALCLLSGYRQRALAQVSEIAGTYPIDGLWSDILTAGPCVCHRCAAAFAAEFGRAMPTTRGDDGWLDLIRFSQRTLREYLDEQRAALKSERPLAALIPNFYGTSFVDAVIGLSTDHLDVADIGSTEGYTDWHGLGFPSFAASYIQAGVLGRPTEVLVSRFVHTWDFTMRSQAQLRFEAFTVAAHGSTVSVDDQPYATGEIEPEVYRRLAPVYARIAERSPWLNGARPERYAAIYASQSARELESLLGGDENPSNGEQSAQFPRSEPRSAPSDLVAAVTGSYRALVESHLPVQFVDERPASLARLTDFRVLVLADVLALTPSESAAIAAFVKAGGGLVVTGEVGVRATDGTPGVDPVLAELLGVTFGEPGPFTFPYIRLAEGLSVELGTWPIPHYGRISALETPAADAEVLAWRTDPVLETDGLTYWHNNQPAPGAESHDPVIVERAVGEGRVIVSAARLGNNRARLGHGAYRDLLAALVRRAARSEPPVALLGTHRNTELILARRSQELIVHLVTGYPVVSLDLRGASQPAAIEDVARLDFLRLRVPDWARTAARIVDGVEVGVEIVGSGIVGSEIELRHVDDWETVVLRGDSPRAATASADPAE